MFKRLLSASLLLGATTAHLAAFHKGMYCLNGVSGQTNYNSYDIVSPLYQLPFRDWWFHHVNRCDEFPPAPGDFLDLPAGGSFMVEIASNRAKTTLSYGGRDASDWPDGNHYPEDYNEPGCIIHPNMHAQNQSMAAGTAFAISYNSDIKQVTPENLVVFTVRHKTPWKRVVWYDVPAAMPACPPEGCICAWGWVPNGCGQPNIYHTPFRCRVTNVNTHLSTPLAPPKPPVWCEDNPAACTRGAKQMIYWNQLEGNNIFVEGLDRRGEPKSPGYNEKCGFADGAQNDIFAGAPSNGGNGNNGGGSGNVAPPSQPPSGGSRADPNANGNSESNGNTNGNGNANANPGGSGNGNSNTNSGGSSNTNTNANSNGNSNPNSNSPTPGSSSSSTAPTEADEFVQNDPPACRADQARRRRRGVEQRVPKPGRHGRHARSRVSHW